MTGKQEKIPSHRVRSWIITLGVFFILQLIFFTLDGTALEPNLNDSDNIAGRAADWLQESEIFTEWITPYSFPWFNMVTTFFVIALLVKAITDLFSRNFSNK